MKKLDENKRELALDILKILDGQSINDATAILNAVKKLLMLGAFLDLQRAKELLGDDDD